MRRLNARLKAASDSYPTSSAIGPPRTPPCTSTRSTALPTAWHRRHHLELPGGQLRGGDRGRRCRSEEQPSLMAWARDYWSALHPLSAGGGYVNMMMDEGEDNVKAAYRDHTRDWRRSRGLSIRRISFGSTRTSDPPAGRAGFRSPGWSEQQERSEVRDRLGEITDLCGSAHVESSSVSGSTPYRSRTTAFR